MTRNELLDAFTPIYDQFVKIGFGEASQVHPKIYDVIDDPTKDYKYNSISGMGAWDSAEEDSDTGLDHFVIGYEGSVSQVKYRKYFYVTFEVNEQIEYASLKSSNFKAEALGAGGRARVEIATAAKLYNGFSVAGSDGVYTFHDSHPKNPEETSTTYDNLLSGPFSHDALEAAEKQIAANHFDMDGLPIVLSEKPILAYAPALAGAVGRVLSERAGERPGVTTRDINLYSGKYIPVEWAYLGAALGGSDTAWYIIYPSLKNLKMIWGARPQFASWIENIYQRYYFDAWEHFSVAITDWRGLFGSTGL